MYKPVIGSILTRPEPKYKATHKFPSTSMQWPSGIPSTSFENLTTCLGLLIDPVSRSKSYASMQNWMNFILMYLKGW